LASTRHRRWSAVGHDTDHAAQNNTVSAAAERARTARRRYVVVGQFCRFWAVGDDGLVKRVSIVGNAGSGKSRLAGRIAALLGVTHIELDAIHHLVNWEPIDPDEFLVRVAAVTTTESWVIDGNYRTVVVDGPVWQRADTVVWLDLPRRTVMAQVIRRTLRRMIRREELWNGNREPLRNLYAWDPHKSIIRWAWTQHAKYRERFGAAMTSPALDHIEFVRLRSHDESTRWLASLESQEL
jgi:adenylate kinase family enzyme